MLIPRTAQDTLLRWTKAYPILVVTGPRQSGKTTLVRATYPDLPYVSLEDLDERERATTDPRSFLGRFPGGGIIDEVQRAPDLFSYLQTRVDETGDAGQFVLTGSQQPGVLAGVSQSLAGRAGLLTLLPFSLQELSEADRGPGDLDVMLTRGSYPPLFDRPHAPDDWYASYVASYVERDVRQLIGVRDLSTFQRFLKLCAGRTAQLLNLSQLATDVGVTHNTIRAWVSVLEASFITHRLTPHHRNFSKRLTKMPKLYFVDVGLAAHLLGIEGPAHLATHAHRGALFETWVVGELLKARLHRGKRTNLSFWRDRHGHEVDIIVDRGGDLRPVEVKSGRTVNADFFRGLRYWSGLADENPPGTIVYGGDTEETRDGMEVIPWSHLEAPDQLQPLHLRAEPGNENR